MDSHFINFDGRSVHDMIELLLAASGDPEAITRLREEIQAVDAKFGPVNDELAELSEDTGWQDITLIDGITAPSARIRKKDKIVFIHLAAVSGVTIGNPGSWGTPFAVLPEELRPSNDAVYTGFMPGGVPVFINILANGNMRASLVSGASTPTLSSLYLDINFI